MRVAVYTVALNEEKHVERWYESTRDADVHLIADTGSTDKTRTIARKLGIKILSLHLNPWRFDDSRNAALAALPADIDYCVSLDVDEVLLPGWREGLEDAHVAGIDWPKYNYVFSWRSEGIPNIEFKGIKIHPRWGVRWKYPIHEIPVACDGWTHNWGHADVTIHHLPDNEKSRGQYLTMLESAAREEPHSARLAYYLARDYYFAQKYEEATREFLRYLASDEYPYPEERCEAYRYLSFMDPDNAEFWLKQAISQNSGRREPYVDLARFYADRAEWNKSLHSAQKALEIVERPKTFLCEARAWGGLPHDQIAVAAYQLKQYELALEHGRIALEFDPDDDRLIKNQEFYEVAISEFLNF